MRRFLALATVVVALAGCSSAWDTNDAGASIDPARAALVSDVVERSMQHDHLRSVIVRVTVDGENLITQAWGESLPGEPATTEMHFRNGAVAISYVSTLLLQLREQGVVSLDDPLSTWLPEVPHADRVTLGQLASMTSGYHDHVLSPEFATANYADPFRTWTPEELVAYVADDPLWYEPGTNWNYAHTNYVLLGLALERATGRPIQDLLQADVLGPLGLVNTADPGGAALPEPVLHAYTGERHDALGAPVSTSTYEESTFWNPSWTLTRGAIQYTDIFDMERSAIAIGTGELLTPEDHALMVSTRQSEFGFPVEGCSSCRRGTAAYTYGMGIVIKGDWLLQNPAFSGYSGVMAYLPDEGVAISLATTYQPEAFTAANGYLPPNAAYGLFGEIAAALVPDQAPPR